MLGDANLTFSDAQAITATAASTDFVDLGETGNEPYAPAPVLRDIGATKYIELLVQVVQTFNNLTSLRVDVQVDSASDFATPKTVASSTVLLADLAQGSRVPVSPIPPGTDERYWRLLYTVTGPAPTAGAITAMVVAQLPSIGR